ncbi:MAG: zf-HC2 domain-containing protein [Gemmataceae bacterium]|nr:zf-HC2 domain-containing protein [Gemmataceae bacterium]MCS7271084.1 zf-HC2 domain-containing protein [Gemmataceae bacterium]MDW8244642.1 zf-HC2 domain-containing protein [Thermogemmata sp.]
MTCAELLQLLDDYLTGQLFYEQQQVVELHVSTCEHCRTQLISYRYTLLAVRQLPKQLPLPPQLAQRLWHVMQAEYQRLYGPDNTHQGSGG